MKRTFVLPVLALATVSLGSLSSCNSSKNQVTSIEAVAKKTNFKLDESIKKEDVTVTLIYKDNTKEETTDFTFETSKDYYSFQISDIGEAEVKIYAKGQNTTVKVNVTADPTFDKIKFSDFSESAPYTCSVKRLSDKLSGFVVIPETYTSSTDQITYTVTEVADEGFQGCNLVSGFYLPKTIKVIGEYAFASCDHAYMGSPDINLEDCVQLENIRQRAFDSFGSNPTIPDSVKYIGSRAFYFNDDNVEKLPESLISIGSLAFSFNSIPRLTIPKNVTSIGEYAFDLSGVNDLTIDSPDVANFKDNDSHLLDATNIKIKSTISLDTDSYIYLHCEPSGSEGDYTKYSKRYLSYKIIDEVNKYCAVMGGSCTGEVYLPTTVELGGVTYTVTQIGYRGFDNSSITAVHIPSSIKTIHSSFYYCYGLKKAYFESPIGWSAGMTSLDSHDIENPDVAAEYLTKTYAQHSWYQS